jgi:hypothetical protein
MVILIAGCQQAVNSLLILNQSIKLDSLGNSEMYFSYSFLYAKIITPDFLNDINFRFWNSSTNIVLSPILSHIYQHENELKQYFIKYKACIVHFGECSSLKKQVTIIITIFYIYNLKNIYIYNI